MMIKVAIAEDNVFLARDLVNRINQNSEFRLKYAASNGEDLLNYLEEDALVDLVLMDIEMPVLNGIEATKNLKSKFPHIKVIMLTIFDDENNIFNAIRAGANGYLLKDEPFDKIVEAVMEVMDGGAPMTGAIAAKALKLLQSAKVEPLQSSNYKLSRRETDVLEQLCAGLTYQEIAANLCISPKTVRKHIENVYTKLNVHSKLEAVELAKSNRLV